MLADRNDQRSESSGIPQSSGSAELAPTWERIRPPRFPVLVPQRVVEPVSWVAHAPFVMWLVEQWQPRSVVVDGVGSGNSLLAICQAVKMAGIQSSVVGIDSWNGGTDAGRGGQAVYEAVRSECDSSYGSFASLRRQEPSEALKSIPDGSVDLLHLDVGGPIEVVRHRYQTWLPKMSDQGVILIHRTQVCQPGSDGALRVWAEARQYYPHCEFSHGEGLGVLFVGPAMERAQARIRDALCSPDGSESVRGLFASFGSLLAAERGTALRLASIAADMRVLCRELESRGSALARLQAILEKARAERDKAQLRAGEVDSLERALAQARQELEALQANLGRLQATLEVQQRHHGELVAHRDSLVAELSNAQAEVAALSATVSQQTGELAAAHSTLERAHAERETERHSLERSVDARDAEIALLRSAIAGAEDVHRLALRGLEGRVGEVVAELDRRNRELASRAADLDRCNRELASRAADLEDVRTQVNERTSALEGMARDLRQQKGISRGLRAIVDRRWSERVDVFTSRTWRLWEPVREVLTRLVRRRKTVSMRLVLLDAWAAALGRPSLVPPPHRDPLLDVQGELEEGIAADGANTADWMGEPAGSDGSRSSECVEFRSHPGARPPVDLLAFYLPQFHPIPENDKWWGEGFTEWRNVVRGRPRFPGHYQPKLPGPLGYYDLRVPETLRKQAELARNYGVSGFVFHLYWFAGKRLLERPLDLFASDPEIALPFCVCWANENWSRRWDGREQYVLIAQQHSPEDDIRFISEVAKYLRNPRYWRIEGKPLLIVYWAAGLPDPHATADRWREWCRENGIGEIHLAAVESLSVSVPSSIGFDSTIEFPPNLMGPPPARGLAPFDPNFGGAIYDYARFSESASQPRDSKSLRFRGVCPSWDNEARKPNRGTVLAGANPRTYQRWLQALVSREIAERPRDRRLIFVNAWNEWAEGACLEPDLRYGYAYLEATRAALFPGESGASGRVAVVIHDAHRHGAQLNGMAMAAALDQLGHRPVIVLLGEGALKEQMSRTAELDDWSVVPSDQLGDSAKALRVRGVDTALVNTVVSARVLEALESAGIKCVVMVHEMPGIIRQMGLKREMTAIERSRCPVVFAHAFVRERFPLPPGSLSGRSFLRAQGIYLKSRFVGRRDAARDLLRARFGIPHGAPLIINVGYGDTRKAPDLFGEVAACVSRDMPSAWFAWVGALEPDLQKRMMERVSDAGIAGRMVLPGFTEDVDAFIAGSDVLALTSREDPYPSVALEALQHDVPVVAFEGTGGIAAIVKEELASTAPQWDCAAFARQIVDLTVNRPGAAVVSIAARVQAEGSMGDYVGGLLRIARRPRGGVSVIVPNYNYARYLPARLDSIVAQGHLVGEIVFLDDCSSDDSVKVVADWCARSGTAVRSIVNRANSGNVTSQWFRGVREAVNDFVWIAEADDLAGPGMLDRLMQCMREPDVMLAYCESRAIDEAGNETMPNYRQWLSDLDADRWSRSWVADGREEVARYLSVKNTIPNASAVLFRREALLDALVRVLPVARKTRSCGDWLTYCEVLMHGKIAFVSEALNLHRRHDCSVIGALARAQIASEIEAVHRHVRRIVAVESAADAKAASFLQSLV